MMGRAKHQDPRAAGGGEPAGAASATLRPARKDDARAIAELFQISSEGIADYIWTTLRDDYPGLEPLEIGEQRYRRESTAFSYQNCLVVEREGAVVAMMHAFPIAPAEEVAPPSEAGDPVLRPYGLEAPGSLYVSAMAVRSGHRGKGIGLRLLEAARQRARALGVEQLSLLCFAENTGARRLYDREGFTVVDRSEVVPHPLIQRTGEVLLMTAPV